MGRRPSLFSKRSQAAFAKQSPTSKLYSGVFLIVLSCVGIIVGTIFSTNDRTSLFGIIFIIPSMILLIFGIISCSVGISEKSKQNRFEEAIVKSNMRQIDQMDGKMFEKYLLALFKLKGYTGEITKASGDYGVDLILYSSSGNKIIIQAKCYSNKVSIGAIQEISAARNYYGTNNAWVITNNYFTNPAINLAQANNVKLIDRKELADLINSTTGAQNITHDEIFINKPVKQPVFIHTTQNTSYLSQNNTLLAENDYNNSYIEQLQKIKNEVISLYAHSDFEGIAKKIEEAETIKRKTEKNNASLHFFYQDLIGIIYALRYSYENAIDECLELCDKDIEILKHTNLKNVTVLSLSKKAIIYEKRGKIQEAIDICDYGIAQNFFDNGKPFIVRRERLLKKLNHG